jgi:hypothetical protein
MICTTARILLIGASAAIVGACSQEDDASLEPAWSAPLATPLRTLPWVNDFKLGTPPLVPDGLVHPDEEFAPGEPIQLSMAINYAPRNAFVVAHWYGPQSETVDLQTKELSAGKKRLHFEQDETGDWQEGMYRVEVWIRGYKLGERRFQITGVCGPDMPTASRSCATDSS